MQIQFWKAWVKPQNIGAFSLLELLVTISVLFIIASLSAVNYQNALALSKIASVHSKSQSLSKHYVIYQIENDSSPLYSSYSYVGGNDILIKNPSNDIADMFRNNFLAHISPSNLIDPFAVKHDESDNFLCVQKKALHELFPFAESNSSGCIIISKGPDQEIARLASLFQFAGIVYNPSNGIMSNGDIFKLIPENHTPSFVY